MVITHPPTGYMDILAVINWCFDCKIDDVVRSANPTGMFPAAIMATTAAAGEGVPSPPFECVAFECVATYTSNTATSCKPVTLNVRGMPAVYSESCPAASAAALALAFPAKISSGEGATVVPPAAPLGCCTAT